MATAARCPTCGSWKIAKHTLESTAQVFVCENESCTFACPDSDIWMYLEKISEGIPDPDKKSIKPTIPQNPGGKDLRQETKKWIDGNELAAGLFLKFAQQLAAKQKKFGIKLIAERIRWEFAIQYSQEFKINNNYPAYIARWVVHKDPAVEPFLNFRETKY